MEDETPAQALLVRELEAVATSGVDTAGTLGQAFDAVKEHDYDCAVLDLSLPDGWGLDTLLQFRRHAPRVPVVVVSGTQGSAFEAKARRSGAMGYVQKGVMTPGQVAEAVVAAVTDARAGLMVRDPIEELAAVGAHRSPVTASLFGQADLPDAMPDRFDQLVAQYGDLLELALERTAFKSEMAVSDHLRDLAYSLGTAGAGPRDVVRLHAKALDEQSEKRQGAGAPDFMHEARLVVLELMGYLASYYRQQSLGRVPTMEGEGER